MLLSSVQETLSASGFYAYLTLVFSGDSAVYAFSRELAYALIESVPSLAMGIVLVLAMFCVWSFGESMSRITAMRARVYG